MAIHWINTPFDRVQHAEEVRSAYAEVFEQSAALTQLSRNLLGGVELAPQDGCLLVKGTLLLRHITALEAMTLLLAQGFYTEALVQNRSLLEALARLSALCKKPELFDEYVMQDQLNRKRLFRDIIQFRESWTADMPKEPSDEELITMSLEVEKEIESHKKTTNKKLRVIKTLDWADIGGVTHLLLGQYVIASQAVHHAPRDLERRYIVEDDELVGISMSAEPGLVQKLLFDSNKLVFVAVQWFSESIGVEVPEPINDLYQRHTDAYEKLAERELGDT